VDISFKDDVTVILLLGVSFMVGNQSGTHRENIRGGKYRCRHYIYKWEQSMTLPPPSPSPPTPLLQLAKEAKRVVFRGFSDDIA
jgi:hypothetical protein